MFDAAGIIGLGLAVIHIISATGKLMRLPQVVANLGMAGVQPSQFPPLAFLELAAAIGLIIGLWWSPIGIAAAVGSTLYFAGAIVAHLRHGNRSIGPGWLPPRPLRRRPSAADRSDSVESPERTPSTRRLQAGTGSGPQQHTATMAIAQNFAP